MNDPTAIKLCAFDAYGTLFDVDSPVARCRDALGDRAETLGEAWRARQLQYTWLRSLTGRFEDFWQVTGQALDYALESQGVGDCALRARLMQLYLRLDAHPEVPEVLGALRKVGMKTVILSNGSEPMLVEACKNAAIDELLDRPLSADAAHVFKPHPAVYRLVTETYDATPGEVLYCSSNAWDVAAAADFGFRVAWINRSGQPPERLPGRPEMKLPDLRGIPGIVGG